MDNYLKSTVRDNSTSTTTEKSTVRDNSTSTTTESHADLGRAMEGTLRYLDASKDPEGINLIKLKIAKGFMVKGGIEVC